LASLNPILQKNGVQSFEQAAEGAGAVAVFQSTGGAAWTAPLSTIAPSVYRAASNFATPYSQQAGAAVQHQLGRNLTATASYLFVRGVKLSRTRNINLLPSGRDFSAGRAHATYDNVYELEDAVRGIRA
jgi:hypothetical protein